LLSRLTQIPKLAPPGPQTVAKLRQVDLDPRTREHCQDLHDAIPVIPRGRVSQLRRASRVRLEESGERVEPDLERGLMDDITGEDDDSPPPVRRETVA
jgi:hypothetical protein